MIWEYIFYYELYDGVKGSQTLELTDDELWEVCIKYDCDGDILWWDYEQI